jgi:multidrug efflux pump subunit AcrA (membrane-fusion protein)
LLPFFVVFDGLFRQKHHTVTLGESLRQTGLEFLAGHRHRAVVADKPSHHAVKQDTRVALGDVIQFLQDTLDRECNPSLVIPDADAYLTLYAELSRRTRAARPPLLTASYGEGPLRTLRGADLRRVREQALAKLNALDLSTTLVVTNTRRWLALGAAGAVITPGLLWAVLGRIETQVEAAGALVADATPGALTAVLYVPPAELALVRPGQAVQLKLAAYPFHKYGLLEGVVATVSVDATEAGEPGGLSAGHRSAVHRYRALVDAKRQSLVFEGTELPLTAGMLVDAEMQLGSRSVLEYVLSPVRKAFREAGRER